MRRTEPIIGNDVLVLVCMTAYFTLATILAGGVSLVIAQERIDLTRYSLVVPAGWSAQRDRHQNIVLTKDLA